MYEPDIRYNTFAEYSPHELLPAPEPKTIRPPPDYFYHNVAKHLVRDTVRIMHNGLNIDMQKVEELEKTIDKQLDEITKGIASNRLVQAFLGHTHAEQIAAYKKEQQSKCKAPKDFIKAFSPGNMIHRSYFMHLFAQANNIPLPIETLENSSISKWPVLLVKRFTASRPVLQRLLEGTLTHPLVDQATLLLAQHKCAIYNEKYVCTINSPNVPYPEFNPKSSTQKRLFFAFYGITSDKISKETGLSSWDRSEVERVHNETADEDLKEFTQHLINHSFAAIIQNNFVASFYKYTVNGRLHGKLHLFGAKTFRLTSSQPNLLNLPSTGSVFAKPVKQCFTAPPGTVILAIDYSALTTLTSAYTQ